MKLKKILLPLDGSDLAERVALPAARLAEGVGTELVLLTVVAPTVNHSPQDPVARAVQTEPYEAGLYLKSMRSRILPLTLQVETAVRSGLPAQEIIRYVQENGVDLIIMTTHGRSGLTRWSFGRTAEKVVRRAPCPTVIMRSQQQIIPDQIKRILVPLDGSALAEQVLAPTFYIASGLKAEVILLQVMEAGPLQPEGRAPEAEKLASMYAYLESIRQRLQARGIQAQAEVLVGPVADKIVDFADANQIDLIVLSNLGSSGLQMWMFGSVAERVMKGAHCTTMIIRQPNPNLKRDEVFTDD
ncbi:MAG: universal stress protein [Chloroflexi bacterium]|nr:universal stress protein [Chloroflexota bacterium]